MYHAVATPSGRAWRTRPVSQRENAKPSSAVGWMANQQLVEQIKAVHADSKQTYGSPRIYRQLQAQGVPCSENRVARLMRKHGIQARQVKRYKVTTKANKAHSVAPNLLDGDFSASRPDETWLTDISFIPTRMGWLRPEGVAVVMDLFSRRIVGWAMSSRMTSTLVEDALVMAIRRRKPPKGLIHHSDRGSQYTSESYQQLLSNHNMLSTPKA